MVPAHGAALSMNLTISDYLCWAVNLSHVTLKGVVEDHSDTLGPDYAAPCSVNATGDCRVSGLSLTPH